MRAQKARLITVESRKLTLEEAIQGIATEARKGQDWILTTKEVPQKIKLELEELGYTVKQLTPKTTKILW